MINTIYNHSFAAKTLIEVAGDTIKFCTEEKRFYIYDPCNGMWCDTDEALIALVHRHQKVLQFYQYDENNEIKMFNYSGMQHNVQKSFLTNYTECVGEVAV